jgi:hypothetical protein
MENVQVVLETPTASEQFNQGEAPQMQVNQDGRLTEKKQSRLSKLFQFLTNLDSGFPLSGA